MSDAKFRQTMRERYGIDVGEHGIYRGEALRLVFAEPVRHHNHALLFVAAFGGISIGIVVTMLVLTVFG
jgi:hypothetical protein